MLNSVMVMAVMGFVMTQLLQERRSQQILP